MQFQRRSKNILPERKPYFREIFCTLNSKGKAKIIPHVLIIIKEEKELKRRKKNGNP